MMDPKLSKCIYNFLILNGAVSLPGLGSFEIVHLPAINDLNNHRILPPSTVVKFSRNESKTLLNALLGYMVRHLTLSEVNALELLTNFCKEIKKSVDAGSSVVWKGLGDFVKSSDGQLDFVYEQAETTFLMSTDTTESSLNKIDTVADEIIESDLDEIESNVNSSSFIKFKASLIILISIMLLFFIYRYSLGNFNLLSSRFEKVNPQDPPDTYKK